MLRKEQKEAARVLYEGRHSDEEIREQFGISAHVWQKWQELEEFQKELRRHCERTNRETRLILTRCGPIAALRLAELLGADKPDVARRAALDMVDRCLGLEKVIGKESEGVSESGAITEEQAQNMILELAKGLK